MRILLRVELAYTKIWVGKKTKKVYRISIRKKTGKKVRSAKILVEDYIFKLPTDGNFLFAYFRRDEKLKLKDVCLGVLTLQMRTCVLYKNPPSYPHNHERGVVISSPSNLIKVRIINLER
jgi:hypothetical protein